MNFKECFEEMPWLALQWSDMNNLRSFLDKKYAK